MILIAQVGLISPFTPAVLPTQILSDQISNEWGLSSPGLIRTRANTYQHLDYWPNEAQFFNLTKILSRTEQKEVETKTKEFVITFFKTLSKSISRRCRCVPLQKLWQCWWSWWGGVYVSISFCQTKDGLN